MEYAYELVHGNGMREWSVQKHMFSEEQMLNAFRQVGVVEVKFHASIPNGRHLCGCGNIALGDKDELCEECMRTYGHRYEHEL